jgi:flagellar biosynthesis protein FlhG
MPDQAQGLRVLASQARAAFDLGNSVVVSSRNIAPARTIAVTSGKGGVGKTNFSANLALLLAKAGQRVVVVDADLGLANLHVVLGVSPRYHLGHIIRGEKSLRDVLHTAPQGFDILAGGSGIAELANLGHIERQRFIHRLAELDDLADIVLIDTGAGLSDNVLSFVTAAEEVIVVTTPEPTALADAYATIKVVSRDNPDALLSVVVNMAATEAEADATAERLRLVAKQFLDIDLGILGVILQDPAVPRAVRAQRPVVAEWPAGPTARALGRMVDTLGYRESRPAGVRGFLNRVSHYFQPAG